jgi:phosphate starvation-inducible PhoH-like protein
MLKPSLPVILHRLILPKNQRSGLEKATRILKNIDGIAHIELDEEDVVRHRLVKAIIKAYDREQTNVKVNNDRS